MDDDVFTIEEKLNLLHSASVLKWTRQHRINGAPRNFNYTAMKAQGRWFTTASHTNTVVECIMSNAELALELIDWIDTVQVASDWRSL